MLLANDVVEGRDAAQMDEADRVFLLLKSHMRRLRGQLQVPMDQPREVKQLVAVPQFQAELEAQGQEHALQLSRQESETEATRMRLRDLRDELERSKIEAAKRWKRSPRPRTAPST